ncbi:MAG: topoisomerase (poxvirus type) [Proteobacteria bacterium]|nr:topoisomerase (poxvirus type) [Pseudomonadota bacterium]
MNTAVIEVATTPDGLVHVSDDAPGISRLRRGKGFIYCQADGHRLSDARQLERIRKLAIPPAYTSVWICPLPCGHLQATGRDARDRKQYIYHAEWRRARDETKFDRMSDFGAVLPRIRAKVMHDLDVPIGAQDFRQTVIAAIVCLLDTTLVRVGNDEYARNNGSFGLTTLRKRHVDFKGSWLRLRFRGKSGIRHEVSLQDRRISRIVRRCQALPGQELFQYLDDAGDAHSIGSMDVNDYLRLVSGGEFTAKDFRTWHGSVYALELWRQLTASEREGQTAESTKRLLSKVARRLGNTVAVCRKSYVHPRILALLTGEATTNWQPSEHPPPRKAGLTLGEREFLAFLRAESSQ